MEQLRDAGSIPAASTFRRSVPSGATGYFFADLTINKSTCGDARVSKDGDWSETYACNLIDWHLKEQEEMPWLTGSAYWPFKDFATPLRPENPIPYVNQKGVVQRDLTPKGSYYVFQSYWSDTPMIRLYGKTWPVRWGEEGEAKLIKVYSNCPSVELFVDGLSQGVRQRESQDFPAAGLRWRVPLSGGDHSVRAVAHHGEAVLADEMHFRYQTEEWTTPTRLRLEVVEESGDTATVMATAVDGQGTPCLDAKHRIRFSLVGSGALLADQGTATGSRVIELANGVASIVVMKGDTASTVSATASGLLSQSVVLKKVVARSNSTVGLAD